MSQFAQLDQMNQTILSPTEGQMPQQRADIPPGIPQSNQGFSQGPPPSMMGMPTGGGMQQRNPMAQNPMAQMQPGNPMQQAPPGMHGTPSSMGMQNKYTQYTQKTKQEFAMNPNNAQGNNAFNLSRMSVPQELRTQQQKANLQNVAGYDAQGNSIAFNSTQNTGGYQPHDNSYNSQFANNFMVVNPNNQNLSVNRLMEKPNTGTISGQVTPNSQATPFRPGEPQPGSPPGVGGSNFSQFHPPRQMPHSRQMPQQTLMQQMQNPMMQSQQGMPQKMQPQRPIQGSQTRLDNHRNDMDGQMGQQMMSHQFQNADMFNNRPYVPTYLEYSPNNPMSGNNPQMSPQGQMPQQQPNIPQQRPPPGVALNKENLQKHNQMQQDPRQNNKSVNPYLYNQQLQGNMPQSQMPQSQIQMPQQMMQQQMQQQQMQQGAPGNMGMQQGPMSPSTVQPGFSSDNFVPPPQQQGMYSGNVNYQNQHANQNHLTHPEGFRNPYMMHQNNQLDQMRRVKNGSWNGNMTQNNNPNPNQPQQRQNPMQAPIPSGQGAQGALSGQPDDLQSFCGSECGTSLAEAFAPPSTQSTFSQQFAQARV